MGFACTGKLLRGGLATVTSSTVHAGHQRKSQKKQIKKKQHKPLRVSDLKAFCSQFDMSIAQFTNTHFVFEERIIKP